MMFRLAVSKGELASNTFHGDGPITSKHPLLRLSPLPQPPIR